jgi:hypothetical protein
MKNFLLIFISSVAITCMIHNNQESGVVKGNQDSIPSIENNKIKYSIVLMACDTCVPISNAGYRVIVDLTSQIRNKIDKTTCQDWMALLNDKKSDWAANLVLYSIYKRNALILSRNNSRELWVKSLKKDDLRFWRDKLCPK